MSFARIFRFLIFRQGIAPTMIFVRVGLGDATQSSLSSSSDRRERLHGHHMRGGSNNPSQVGSSGDKATLSIGIPITRTIEVRRDDGQKEEYPYDGNFEMHSVASRLPV
jgi:hypothetical protein